MREVLAKKEAPGGGRETRARGTDVERIERSEGSGVWSRRRNVWFVRCGEGSFDPPLRVPETQDPATRNGSCETNREDVAGRDRNKRSETTHL